MSVVNTVSWFEIGAPDVEAAKAFYGPLFDWSFAPDGAYTLITAPGAAGPSGGIFGTGGGVPPYAVFVVQVADVAATAARAEELGGKVVVAPKRWTTAWPSLTSPTPTAACSLCSARSRRIERPSFTA